VASRRGRSRCRLLPGVKPASSCQPELPSRLPDGDDQKVRPHEQHDETLDDPCEIACELRVEDRRVERARRSAVQKRSEDERGEEDTDGRVAPEERDCDAEEADLRALHDREVELRKKAGLKEQGSLSLHFPLQNIRGIEIDGFAVALARVTVWMGQKLAVDELGLDEATLPLADLSGIQSGTR